MSPTASTYHTFKASTTKIATWLGRSAERCGVDVPKPEPVQNDGKKPAKGKKSKVSSPPAKHLLKLDDFIRFTKAIAASEEPKISFPKHIASLIQGVIQLRKQATDVFIGLARAKRTAALDKANAGHRHFVTVLDTVLAIFQPKHEHSAAETKGLTNLFEALTVDEITADDGEMNPTTPPTASKVASSSLEYDLEPNAEDKMFRIFSLFKDVNEVREYIRGVWRDYRDGRVDVMSAAVTTDTAFVLLKHGCEDAMESIPGQPNYPAMITLLNDYMNQFGGPSGSAFRDWTSLRVANVLNSYEDVLQPGNMPMMKPGYLGVYNPMADRAGISDQERCHEDLIIPVELLPEFTKLSRIGMYVPAQDELTTGLRKMMDANSMDALPMHAIFGTQILLDIHHVLREMVGNPFLKLQATGKRVMLTIDDYFKYSRDMHIKNWPEQNDEVFTQVNKEAEEWTQEDRVAKAISKMGQKGKYLPIPYHLLKNHPPSAACRFSASTCT